MATSLFNSSFIGKKEATSNLDLGTDIHVIRNIKMCEDFNIETCDYCDYIKNDCARFENLN